VHRAVGLGDGEVGDVVAGRTGLDGVEDLLHMAGSVISAGPVRPIGKLSGALAGFSAADLGGFAIKAALERAGVTGEQVDYVFMGQVLQAGAGQITARQAAVKAGIPMSVPSTTVNKVCLSGINAIYLADLMIQAGEADIVVAGGMESMTNAPYLLPGARGGYRIGDKKVVDSMMYDGLWRQFDQVPWAPAPRSTRQAPGHHPRGAGRGRRLESHRACRPAQKDGLFDDEIVPVEIPSARATRSCSDRRGRARRHHAESLGKLRPAFDKAGNITAGNASQISDGGAAVVVMPRRPRRRELGVTPLGEIVGYGQVAGPDASLLTSRAGRSRRSSAPARRSPTSTCSSSTRPSPPSGRLDARPRHHRRHRQRQRRRHRPRPPDRHVRHPRRAHPALELARRGGGIGAAALCGGGGQGDAILAPPSTAPRPVARRPRSLGGAPISSTRSISSARSVRRSR
jgi:acetyl-CoA C-acetyltransferase